jgi:hypothetical protein
VKSMLKPWVCKCKYRHPWGWRHPLNSSSIYD